MNKSMEERPIKHIAETVYWTKSRKQPLAESNKQHDWSTKYGNIYPCASGMQGTRLVQLRKRVRARHEELMVTSAFGLVVKHGS